jgi:alginate O-acetyltransferase complex protein AlgI
MPMVVWKLWFNEFSITFNLWGNHAAGMLSTRLGEIDLARDIIIPIGFSFATFRAIDLLVKIYIGRYQRLPVDRLYFYGFFPSVQVVGPIIEYSEIAGQGENFETPSSDDLFQGVLRIAVGLLKVLVISSILQNNSAVFHNYNSMPVHMVWLGLFLYMWFFYLNFSGYSDLAIGTSRLFGFKLKENFNFPYFRSNISEFWNNWHMSLSRFAQRNAFVPLGGYRKKTQILAIFATIMVIALWHDISVGMLLFGAYHGAGLVTHRILADRKSNQVDKASTAWHWAMVLLTYVFVALSFPLLALPLNKAAPFYLALFGG